MGTVFFFLKNRTAPYAQYFQNAKKENWDTVAVVDKKALTEYMEGKTDTCSQIDTSMPNLPVSAGSKRAGDAGDDQEQSDKRKVQKVDGPHEGHDAAGLDIRPENPEDWSIEQIYAQEKEKFDPVKAMVISMTDREADECMADDTFRESMWTSVTF